MKALVIVARGLQAAALGCYGNTWIDTPSLDALAAKGVVFDQHFADAANAAGARHAWRSGRYHLPATDASSPDLAPDLLDILHRQHAFTYIIVDNSRSCQSDFALGWDRVEHVVADENETPLERVLDAVRTALQQLVERDNWLLWVDLATPLPPWDVPAEFQEPYFREESLDDEEVEADDDEEPIEYEPLLPLPDPIEGPLDPEDDELFLRLWSSYAAAVSYLDAGIGEVIEAIGHQDVLLLFTADHGYPLGEHNVVGPVRSWPHNELIHVPLILQLPSGAEAGRHMAALTQAVDIAPTLADLFGTKLGAIHGRSLLPLVSGEVEQIRDYAVGGLEVGDAIGWVLRTREWAFFLPVRTPEGEPARETQLFAKPDDRWEMNNVIQHHPELAENLERQLRDLTKELREPPV